MKLTGCAIREASCQGPESHFSLINVDRHSVLSYRLFTTLVSARYIHQRREHCRTDAYPSATLRPTVLLFRLKRKYVPLVIPSALSTSHGDKCSSDEGTASPNPQKAVDRTNGKGSPRLGAGLYSRSQALPPVPSWEEILQHARNVEATAMPEDKEAATAALSSILVLLGLGPGLHDFSNPGHAAVTSVENKAAILPLLPGKTRRALKTESMITRLAVLRFQEEGLVARLELLHETGFTAAQAQRLLHRFPKVLNRSEAALRASLCFLVHRLNFLPQRVCEDTHLQNCLTLDVKKTLEPKLELLDAMLSRPGERAGDAMELVSACPRLLLVGTQSVSDNAAALVKLTGPEHFVSLVCRNPIALSFKAERVINLAKVLQLRCAFSNEDWVILFQRLCSLPGDHSLEEFGERLDALAAAVGEHRLNALVLREPAIVSVEPSIVRSNVEHMMSLMAETEARDLAFAMPQVLSMDWSSRIQPCLDYLCSVCHLSAADVLRSSAITRSLDSVIKPRVELIMAEGIEVVIGCGKGKGTRKRSAKSTMSLTTLARMTRAQMVNLFPGYSGR